MVIGDKLSEREKLIELMATQQIINAEFCNNLQEKNPMLFNLMWKQFKDYLVDDYFTDFERQTVLIKFFQEQTNIDLAKEIITHIENSDKKDVYSKVILEWSFQNSELIKQKNLAKFDGVGLCGKKQKIGKINKPDNLTDEVLEEILSLTIGGILPPMEEN